MNYKRYEIKGRHIETKRIRTLKVDAFNEEDAKKQADEQGIKTIITIDAIPFETPTENQLDYAKDLGIFISGDLTKEDVSALISKAVDKDNEPNQGLLEFATNHRIYTSKHIGKSALYNKLFALLDDIDRVAFFIFSIYRYISDDRHANLDNHPNRKFFYEFANSNVSDERFMKSMNKYSGIELKYFGQLTTPDRWTHTGGSVNTIAFKSAREFLIDKKLIEPLAPYQSKQLSLNENIHYTNTFEQNEKKATETIKGNYTKEEIKLFEKLGISIGLLILIFYLIFIK